MKNKLVLLIILSITLALSLCACGNDSTDTGTESGECAHAYTVVQTRMPTCLETGLSTLECTLCHEIVEVELNATGHNCVATFEWTDDYTHAAVLLECKSDASHVYNVSATIKEEIVQPTCTEVGKQRFTATVSFSGVDYTDVKEFNLGLGECKNTYSFTLLGNSCTDGFEMESVCSACEKKSHASFDSHVLFDMAHFPVCGGEAVVNICPCGKEVEVSKPDLCSGQVELDGWEETDEDGTVYSFEHSFCLRCGFETICKYNETSEGCYTYRHKNTQIVDGETVLFTFDEPNYEVNAYHELVYSYDGEIINSCEDGYVAVSSCKLCGYSKEISQASHSLKFDSEKVELDALGACGGYLIIKKCPCQRESEVGYYLSCDYEYSYENEVIDGELHTVKKYTCQACKMEFIHDEYIKDETVWGIWRLTVNGEIKYEHECEYK